MKRVLFMNQSYSPTDGIIFHGVLDLFKKFRIKQKRIYFRDNELMSPEEFFPEFDADLIVIAGTPWLGHFIQGFPKFENAKTCFKAHPDAKRLFLGIGTSIFLNENKQTVLDQPFCSEILRELFEDSIITARDTLTKEILNDLNIDSKLLPCPAYYLSNPFPRSTSKNEYPVLFYIDPLRMCSQEYWRNNEKELERYNEIVLAFYNNYKPKVFCALPHEPELAKNLGIDNVEVLRDYNHTLKVCAEGSFFLSARVHCAIPSFNLGKPTGIIPMDSRHLTLTDFGCKAIKTPSDTDYFNIAEVNNYISSRKEYEGLIKKVL